MRSFAKWMAGMTLAVAVAGCGGDATEGGISPTGPYFVGATASVTVNCPAQMETGTSGTCTAYGYDSNGSYTNSSVSSWSSSNASVASVTSGGGISAASAGTAVITAVIDGISGTRSVTVVNPAPLSVTMGGPTTVKPNVQCYWWADATGGTPPYSWSWSGGIGGSSWNWEYFATSPRLRQLYRVADGHRRVGGPTHREQGGDGEFAGAHLPRLIPDPQKIGLIRRNGATEKETSSPFLRFSV